MFDGIQTVRAAVDDHYLIRKLNLSTPFSSTDGEVQYDKSLVTTKYKGLFLTGKPRPMADGEEGRYWVHLRGSLIKAANNGLHNENAQSPFALLAVLDDLATNLRIDPFDTPICNLELSVTVRADHAKQMRDNLLSYINRRPNFKTINRSGLLLPYAEVEAGQHKLKLYSPTSNALRLEIKAEKMQYLGLNHPQFLVDLTQPALVSPMADKLLKAFDRIIWQWPVQDFGMLTTDELDLYQRGRVYDYWQVRRQDYETMSEFNREEKNRQREKAEFNRLIARHWTVEPPSSIRRRIVDQLDQYIDILHSGLYETAHELYIERWHTARNLPTSGRVPKRLLIPTMSEIYPLYFGRFQTRLPAPITNSYSCPAKRWLSASDLRSKPSIIAELLSGYKPRRSWSKRPTQTDEERAWKRQRNQASNESNNTVRMLKKVLNAPGGLCLSECDLQKLLSGRAKIALAYSNQTLNSLKHMPTSTAKQLPLFPDYL